MGVDLHSHSRYSDGRCDPFDVARMAWASGLTGLAITDHDTTAHFEPSRDACQTFGLQWVPGVEVSAEVMPGPDESAGVRGPRSVHILALWPDPEGPLQDELLRLHDARRRRALDMIALVNAAGADIDPAPVLAAPAGVSIGRPHVARMMVDAGVVPTTGQAFAQWIGEDGPAYVPKGALHPVQAVQLIRSSGGAAVLAHPTWGGVSAALLDAMCTAGLAGVESPREAYEPDAAVFWQRAARQRGLVVTRGSDFHGEAQSATMGAYSTHESMVDALRARAGREVSTW